MKPHPPENPHAYPFQLIDRIDACEIHRYAIGLKNLTANEPFFQGHFPGQPVMPGVYLIEACAQTAGHVIQDGEQPVRSCYLSGIETFRIRRPVVPGDTLAIRAELERHIATLYRFICTVTREQEIVANGILILALPPV